MSEPTPLELAHQMCPCIYVKVMSSDKPGRPHGCCLICYMNGDPEKREMFDFVSGHDPHCYWPGHKAIDALGKELERLRKRGMDPDHANAVLDGHGDMD